MIEIGLGEWTGPTTTSTRPTSTLCSRQSSTRPRPPPASPCRCSSPRDGRPAGDPFGTVPGDGPIERDPQNDILSLVNISDPADGSIVSGDSFVARGRANSFEGTVPWQICVAPTRWSSEGFATASGTGDRLYPWETEVDVSDLAPGTYTFVAMTDDPSGGEGLGPFTDTRTIIVE